MHAFRWDVHEAMLAGIFPCSTIIEWGQMGKPKSDASSGWRLPVLERCCVHNWALHLCAWGSFAPLHCIHECSILLYGISSSCQAQSRACPDGHAAATSVCKDPGPLPRLGLSYAQHLQPPTRHGARAGAQKMENLQAAVCSGAAYLTEMSTPDACGNGSSVHASLFGLLLNCWNL